MPEWYFEAFRAIGGVSAKTGRDQLESTELRSPAKLARESLQNACDAALDGAGPVSVEYRVERLDGGTRENLIDALQLTGPNSPVSRHLIDIPDDLALLFVEDYATKGLGGIEVASSEPRPEDNFVRLCRNLGDTQQDITGRGGTKGVGKSVYWSHSKLYLVAFYSRFAPTERTGGVSSRFIAVGWFRDHVEPPSGGRRYTGKAWFGEYRELNGEDYVAPLVDDDADAFAESIGFKARSSDETGTSIMVVGASKVDELYLGEIRHAVETHYWPRILDGDLEVAFSYAGTSLGGPELHSRLDLKEYYAAYRLVQDAEGDAPERLEGQAVMPLQYSPQKSPNSYLLGHVGVIAHGESAYEEDNAEDEGPEVGGIALMRAPRMVVQYYTWGTPPVPHAGVFVASKQIEEILQKSEPSAHDQWKDDSEDLEEEEKKVVQNLLPKLRSKVSEFLEEFVEEHVSDVTSSSLLSQELAAFLPIRAGGGGGGASKRFASVQFISQPHRRSAEDGRQRLVAEFSVSVSDEHVKRYRKRFGRDPEFVVVRASVHPVVENGRRLTNRRIEMDTLVDQTGDGVLHGSELRIPVTPGINRRIIAASELLPDPSLTFDMSISADLRAAVEGDNGRGD